MTKSRRYYTGLIYFIVMILLTLLRVAFGTDITSSLSDNQIDIYYTLISQILCMGLVPVGLYVLFLKKEGRKPSEFFSDFAYKKLPVSVIILTVIAGFVFYYLTIGFSAIWTGIITAVFGYETAAVPGTIYTSLDNMIMWLALTALLPGVFEELTHRGLLLNTYREENDEAAVMISALLFALMHQDIRQFGYAFAGGIILGFFLVKSKSIIPPMILHFMNNGINVILGYSYQKGGALGLAYDSFFKLFNNIGMALLLMISWVVAAGVIIGIIILIDYLVARKNKTEPTFKKGFKFKMLRFNREDIFLVASLVLGISTTVFALIWGMMR